MKLAQKFVFLVLIGLIAAGSFVSCARKDEAGGRAADSGSFSGKIAVVTNTVSQNEEEFRSAEQLVAKYGANKIVHVTWPDNFMAEQEQMVTTISRLAADRNIKALILNHAVPGSNAAVDKLLETRNDIFIVYCMPQENPPDVSRRANLILNTNELDQGTTMVQQAKTQGAEVFVHYSFPRHMSIVMLAARRDLIRQECAVQGIQFLDITAPDPTSDAGITGSQQFILEDVPRMVERYGKNTAFFATNCAMQIPLITSVMNTGAIYPQPCCPSPFHGFPSALGIASRGLDIKYMIEETRKVAASRDMLGRLSTWPIPVEMMYTDAGAEYAIKWINDQVPKTGIDDKVLIECMNAYIREVIDENISVQMINYSEGGITFDNFKLLLVDYMTY
jgi:hypothetical protein